MMKNKHKNGTWTLKDTFVFHTLSETRILDLAP